tara:strand:- start:524 stop:817 length:294 start_codon:yes stop_codon:yes gene_type:complete
MPGKLQALHQRFADITIKLFEKHDLHIIGFWTEEVGENNKLIYMLRFHDMNHRDQAWQSFRADPDREIAFAETEKDGPLVSRITNRILKPTLYSPLP